MMPAGLIVHIPFIPWSLAEVLVLRALLIHIDRSVDYEEFICQRNIIIEEATTRKEIKQ